ncbi:MAG: Ig-like domain-containing protein [Pirellulaceae bacterium]
MALRLTSPVPPTRRAIRSPSSRGPSQRWRNDLHHSNGGVVTIATGGKTVNYVPASTFVGTDTFVYTITDSGGLTASAT